MQPAYIVQDENKISGQTITATQGESKSVNLFMFNADGSPLFITGTISAIVAKIFSTTSGASIQKTLAGSSLSKISDSVLGCFGFSFTLTPADTTSMQVNSTGLPMRATVTMSDSSVREFDFIGVFNILAPSVTT